MVPANQGEETLRRVFSENLEMVPADQEAETLRRVLSENLEMVPSNQGEIDGNLGSIHEDIQPQL